MALIVSALVLGSSSPGSSQTLVVFLARHLAVTVSLSGHPGV